MSIAILAPQTTGLAANQGYLPALVQGEFVSNFSGFSAISVLDRVRLDEQYAELLSGYYSDDAEAGMDLGRLTPTDYIMGGSITRTATGYALQMQITKSADKMTTASHSGTFTFAELDNLTGIRRASLDLLEKMGVTPTERTRTELAGAAAVNHVNAQTALAQGITAQRGGTVVEALSLYIQSSNYEPGLAEAASRMNILSANISSGNIGADVRNDLQWRDQWVERLKEAEEYFRNQMANPPYYLVYSTNIKQGAVNYEARTVPLSINMGLHPDLSHFDTVNKVMDTVRQGLQATSRAGTWGLGDWPDFSITSIFYNAYWFTAEILNSEGKSIARNTAGLVYGWRWPIHPSRLGEGRINERGAGYGDAYRNKLLPAESTKEFVFPGVDPNSITDNLTIRISSINGAPAERAAEQRNISIVTAGEFSQAPVFTALNQRRRERDAPYDRGRYTLKVRDILSFESPAGSHMGGYTEPFNLKGYTGGSSLDDPNAILICLEPYGTTQLTGNRWDNNFRRWLIIPPTVTSINNFLQGVGDRFYGMIIPSSVKTIRNEIYDPAVPAIFIIGANVESTGYTMIPSYNENGRKAGFYARVDKLNRRIYVP